MWEPRPLTPLWAFTACYRNSFTFYFYFTVAKSEEVKTRSNLEEYSKDAMAQKGYYSMVIMISMEESPFETIIDFQLCKNFPVTESEASLLPIHPINGSQTEPYDTDSKPGTPISSARSFTLPFRLT
jgi:hypothetical protein